MSAEGIKSIFDWAAVWLAGLTFLALFGSLITGNILNSRQSEKLRQFDKDLADSKIQLAQQQERAARAEQDANIVRLKLESEIQKRAPRQLTEEQQKALASALRGKIPKVNFVVQKDSESKAFAVQLEIIFQNAGAKNVEYEMFSTVSSPGLTMYKPGGATNEHDLIGDPLYEALKKAGLFGGYVSKPFSSLEITPMGPVGPLLPTHEYIVYVPSKPLQ